MAALSGPRASNAQKAGRDGAPFPRIRSEVDTGFTTENAPTSRSMFTAVELLFQKVPDDQARELDDQVPELLILLAQELEFGLLCVGRRQLGEMWPLQLG